MAAATLYQDSSTQYRLEGELDFNSVIPLAEAFASVSVTQLAVNLEAVTDVDSAAVALLLNWKRQMLQSRRDIRFQALPERLLDLVKLYEVEQFLIEPQ